MEEEPPDMVEPIHAYSFFSVGRSGEIHEKLVFEYLDLDGHYKKIIRDDDLLKKEAEKLASNMQFFLNLERVEINREKVKSRVDYVDIFLKGHSDVVSIVYLIDFAGQFVSGINTIETWLEEEIAPYDFEIIWRFPVGTIIKKIDTLLEYHVYDDIITLWALSGQDVGGYERMEFELPTIHLDTRVQNKGN